MMARGRGRQGERGGWLKGVVCGERRVVGVGWRCEVGGWVGGWMGGWRGGGRENGDTVIFSSDDTQRVPGRGDRESQLLRWRSVGVHFSVFVSGSLSSVFFFFLVSMLRLLCLAQETISPSSHLSLFLYFMFFCLSEKLILIFFLYLLIFLFGSPRG